MSGSELQTVLRRRLATQRLVGEGLVGATDAVRLLTSSRISPAPASWISTRTTSVAAGS